MIVERCWHSSAGGMLGLFFILLDISQTRSRRPSDTITNGACQTYFRFVLFTSAVYFRFPLSFTAEVILGVKFTIRLAVSNRIHQNLLRCLNMLEIVYSIILIFPRPQDMFIFSLNVLESTLFAILGVNGGGPSIPPQFTGHRNARSENGRAFRQKNM